MEIKINYIKSFFSLLGKHTICTLGCILFVMVFPAMVESGITQIIYSAFALIVFFDLLYTCAWTIGSKHRRNINIHNRKLEEQGVAKIKYNYYSGLIIAGGYALFNIILCLVCYLLAVSNLPWITVAANLIYKFWFAPFIVVFKYVVRLQYVLWFAIALAPSVPILLGYLSGVNDLNRFEQFVKKLVYKNN